MSAVSRVASLAFCRSLPKVELHAHIGGSIPVGTLRKLIAEHPTATDEAVFDPDVGVTLEDVFALFAVIETVTASDDAIQQVACDVVKEFASENVAYLELRTRPRANPGGSHTSYVDAVLAGVGSGVAEAVRPITVNLLLSIDRKGTLEDAERTVDLAIEYRDRGVVGIDWCGNPTVGTIDTVEPAIVKAKEAGIPITYHIAEVEEVENADRILDLKPDRLGHGTTLNDEQVARVIREGIPMELCPTSNVVAKTVPSYKEHHFAKYWKQGNGVAISTDDCGVFFTNLSREYSLIAEAFELSESDVAELARSAAGSAFTTDDVKAAVVAEIDAFERGGVQASE